MQTKEYYALQLNSNFHDKKKVGTLVTVEKTSNYGRDFCGEYTYKLSSSEHDDVFKVESLLEAVRARNCNTEWYNSTDDSPCREERYFNPTTMDIVKVKETIQTDIVQPKEYPLRLKRLVAHVEKTRRNKETLDFTIVEIIHERLEEALKESIGTEQNIGFSYGEIVAYEMVDLNNPDQNWYLFIQKPDDSIRPDYQDNKEYWEMITKHPERYAIVYYKNT